MNDSLDFNQLRKRLHGIEWDYHLKQQNAENDLAAIGELRKLIDILTGFGVSSPRELRSLLGALQELPSVEEPLQDEEDLS